MALPVRLVKLVTGELALGKFDAETDTLKDVAILQIVPTQQGVQMMMLPYGYPFEQEFEGVICGMSKWGMYVELPNTVEGMVHVSNMTDDHYEYYEDRYELTGAHTNRTYKLGQKVQVRVIGADRMLRTIDFEIVY